MKSAAIDLQTLAAISAFAATEETRYYIGGVHLEILKRSVTYVATDGKRIAARRRTFAKTDAPNTLTGKFIIPLAQCKALRPRRHETGDAVLAGDKSRLAIAVRGVERAAFEPLPGPFPNWRKCVPKKFSGKVAQFNGDYLAAFDRLAERLEIGVAGVAHNGDDGALVRFNRDPETFGVIMPRRWYGPLLVAAPKWAVPA